MAPLGPSESPIKAETSDACYIPGASHFTYSFFFREGHLLTITGLKWVQFSEWFL